MKISQQGLALIRQFEGFSSTPYRCPAGKLTIGYGHVIRENEDLPAISHADAEQLLMGDIAIAEQAIGRLVDVPLKQCQFDALCSFIYNVGVQAFEKSTLCRMLNAENTDAYEEFARWVHAGGQKIPGLITRRSAEMALFRQKT